MNQFVDGAIMMTASPLKVGFLVAEKSYNKVKSIINYCTNSIITFLLKPLIGTMAKAAGSIPVTRPQDSAVPGVGTVVLSRQASDNKITVTGKDTKFLALKKGYLFSLPN